MGDPLRKQNYGSNPPKRIPAPRHHRTPPQHVGVGYKDVTGTYRLVKLFRSSPLGLLAYSLFVPTQLADGTLRIPQGLAEAMTWNPEGIQFSQDRIDVPGFEPFLEVGPRTYAPARAQFPNGDFYFEPEPPAVFNAPPQYTAFVNNALNSLTTWVTMQNDIALTQIDWRTGVLESWSPSTGVDPSYVPDLVDVPGYYLWPYPSTVPTYLPNPLPTIAPINTWENPWGSNWLGDFFDGLEADALANATPEQLGLVPQFSTVLGPTPSSARAAAQARKVKFARMQKKKGDSKFSGNKAAAYGVALASWYEKADDWHDLAVIFASALKDEAGNSAYALARKILSNPQTSLNQKVGYMFDLAVHGWPEFDAIQFAKGLFTFAVFELAGSLGRYKSASIPKPLAERTVDGQFLPNWSS